MAFSDLNNFHAYWHQRSGNALKHIKNGDWILARNEYRKMGRIAFEEGWPGRALRMYLYVCTLDLNGIQNRADLSENMLGGSSLFDPRIAFLARDVVADIALIMERTGIEMNHLRECFFEIGSTKYLPVPARRSWPVLSHALQQEVNLRKQSCCSPQEQKEKMGDENTKIPMYSRSTSSKIGSGLLKLSLFRLLSPKLRRTVNKSN